MPAPSERTLIYQRTRARAHELAPPTWKQLRVLDFIARYARTNGYPPTFGDIAREFGFCKQTASLHVRSLMLRGLVTSVMRSARTLAVTEAGFHRLARSA